jgi:TPR repeat protein
VLFRSTQQQVIIDAIALHWDAILTSEISAKTRMEAKKIAAQLKTLERNGLVASHFINNKNKLYMIEERFFNIWYLMRYGRKKKKHQILWLVSFLRDWCTQDELAEKARNHIALAQCGKLHQRGGYYMAEALSKAIANPELCYEVLSNTKNYLSKSHPEYADSLSDTHSLVFDIAYAAAEDKDFNKAEKYYLMSIENKDSDAMNNLAVLYENEFKDFKKAEHFYLMAIDNKQTNAMFNLALLYENEFQDFKKAEHFYLMAIDNNDKDSMARLAFLYQYQLNESNKAESLYLRLIDDTDVFAPYNLALLYDQVFRDSEKAERYYSMAIENDFKNHMDFLIGTNFVDEGIKNAFLEMFSKYHRESDPIRSLAMAIAMGHGGKYQESIEFFIDFLRLTQGSNDFQKHVADYMIFLISRKQHHLAMNLFQDETYRLQDKIKPVYYALMHLMKDEYPKEYMRMGAEMKETVFEILEKIQSI